MADFDGASRCVNICVYDYKGGAAKTTITINTAAALAKEGKKVLIVDLDPQCNSTQFWNPSHKDDNGPQENQDATQALDHQTEPVEVILKRDTLHGTKKNSTMDAYVSDCKTPLYQMFHALLHDANNERFNMLIGNDDSVKEANGEHFNEKLWLLSGSPLLSQFDSEIAQSLSDHRMNNKNFKTVGIIRHICNKLVEKHDFDVIMMDVSPSNGPLNQVAALSCDFILPPCNASLYSCGSIYGLLETVLPGEDGWFGTHTRIVSKQWGIKWPTSEEGAQLLSYRLPQKPPTLLPILVNNYGIEHKADHLGSRNKRLRVDDQVLFQPSQFVYATDSYVRSCGEVDHSRQPQQPGVETQPPKIRFRTNNGDMVIPFCPSAPVSIAATEALGRPFVEITLEQFSKFYDFDPQECEAEVKKLAKKAKIVKQLLELGVLDSLDISANSVFTREVNLVKERYVTLARWLVTNVIPEHIGLLNRIDEHDKTTKAAAAAAAAQ